MMQAKDLLHLLNLVLMFFACSCIGSSKTANGPDGAKCDPGQYYDVNLPRCEPCGPMCARSRQRDLPVACEGFCGTETSTASPEERGVTGAPLNVTTILLIALPSGVVLVSFVGLFLFFCVTKKKLSIPCGVWKPRIKYPQQETQRQQVPDGPDDHSLHLLGERPTTEGPRQEQV